MAKNKWSFKNNISISRSGSSIIINKKILELMTLYFIIISHIYCHSQLPAGISKMTCVVISHLQDLWQWGRPAFQRFRLLCEIELPFHPHPLHSQPSWMWHHHAARWQRVAGPSRDHHQQSQNCCAEWKHHSGGEKVCLRILTHWNNDFCKSDLIWTGLNQSIIIGPNQFILDLISNWLSIVYSHINYRMSVW